MKKGKDLYIRLSDKGVAGQGLCWDDRLEDPDESLIRELEMVETPLGWKTTLLSLSKVSAEFISVTQCKLEIVGNGKETRITNDYIFKIPDYFEDNKDVGFV